MKVGFLAAPMHPFESYRMVVAIAEEAKVDSVWVPDHLQGCAHPALWPDMALASASPDADAWYDPFPCIGVIGQKSDLPMGVCVTDAIRRRAPDVVRTTLTLHQLCRGGFHLGVGAGEAENLLPFGYDFSTPVADLEEFLIELRALLDHGVMQAFIGPRIAAAAAADEPPREIKRAATAAPCDRKAAGGDVHGTPSSRASTTAPAHAQYR